MFQTSSSGRAAGWSAWALLLGASLWSGIALAADAEQEFAIRCAACHSIGEGRRVGPDLQGVLDRRTEDWAVAFVQDSAKVVASGDAEAVALFTEFAQIPMPPQDLSREVILDLLELTRVAKDPGSTPDAPAAEEAVAVMGDADRGQDLFQGIQRFEKKGPSCISCHSVRNDAVISGGLLGPELTETLKGMDAPAAGQAKVGGFVQAQPIMQRAYVDHAPTDQEVADLAAFLVRINKDQARHMPGDTGRKLAMSGAVGTVLLLGLYSAIWRKRKRFSVNESIYDRQIKSSDL